MSEPQDKPHHLPHEESAGKREDRAIDRAKYSSDQGERSMPRELVMVQVGQCGNQVGCRFWDIALREHAACSKSPIFDEPLSSFFRNVDSSGHGEPRRLEVGSKISTLKARVPSPPACCTFYARYPVLKEVTGHQAVLIDTETGVLNSLLQGPLGEIFDSRQLISDQFGAGNNWAQGHMEYGPKYREEIEESVRRTVEDCSSIQSFFLLHSLGGGTGSGLGTYVLSLLADNYPEVYRFTNSVFPSEDDDVVTSPYNSVLALRELSEHADCVLPMENKALADICRRVEEKAAGAKRGGARPEGVSAAEEEGAVTAGGSGGKAKSFDEMNNIAAHMLTDLTSSMRFEGSLNVDLNEVTMNLVPFPRLKFLLSSGSNSPLPLHPPHVQPITNHRLRLLKRNVGHNQKLSPISHAFARGKDGSSFSVDAMFAEAFHRDTQLMSVEPRTSTYLACALLARGDIPISDMQRNVIKIKKSVRMAHWNPDGFKIGQCSTPPAHQARSLLCLANSCGIAQTFSAFDQRFQKLFRRGAMVHHYDQYMGASGKDAKEELGAAAENLRTLIEEYRRLDVLEPPEASGSGQRMIPAV